MTSTRPALETKVAIYQLARGYYVRYKDTEVSITCDQLHMFLPDFDVHCQGEGHPVRIVVPPAFKDEVTLNEPA